MKPKTAKEYKLVAIDSTEPFERKKMTTSQECANYIRQFFDSDIAIYESSFVLLLNQSNTTIGWVKLSQGGINGTVMDVQLVAKIAIESLAKSVVICHNHPSGQLFPSDADKHITNLVKQGLKLFCINLLDHVILTEDSYFSFLDEGLL